MAKPFSGTINVDATQSALDWGPCTQSIAPEAPRARCHRARRRWDIQSWQPRRSDRDAEHRPHRSARPTYTNFHTTALCSPTRSCLMTGRNHTTNGMATITEAASGFPSSNGHIPFECGTVAEVLGEHGWNTYMTGKWHLTAEDEMNLALRKRSGRSGGASSGSTASSAPRPTSGIRTWSTITTRSSSPPPSAGYHLTIDLTDKALQFIRDAKAVAPDKPFFLYFCPGACHAPHHAPKEWIDKYRGKFDMGYEAYRELVFERQKRMGIITDKAELSPINPYINATSADGKGWPEADTVGPGIP